MRKIQGEIRGTLEPFNLCHKFDTGAAYKTEARGLIWHGYPVKYAMAAHELHNNGKGYQFIMRYMRPVHQAYVSRTNKVKLINK